jgi:dCMP deaminase
MELAQVTAKRSTCLRRSVGCVMLNARGHIIATGYNGVAAGLPHCNQPTKVVLLFGTVVVPPTECAVVEDVYSHACPGSTSPSGTNLDGCQALHAEQNALLQCRDVYEIETCVVTTSPCMTCTKLLLNTGCKTIVYHDEYNLDAQQLWRSAGRSTMKL